MEDVEVNVELSMDFNIETRDLQIVVMLKYIKAVSGTNYITVLFTEGNILDKQLMADFSVEDNYSHRHITRDYLTSIQGNEVFTTKVPGRVYIRVYSYTVPDDWNAENLEVIAFVHEQGASLRVLQVTTSIVQ